VSVFRLICSVRSFNEWPGDSEGPESFCSSIINQLDGLELAHLIMADALEDRALEWSIVHDPSLPVHNRSDQSWFLLKIPIPNGMAWQHITNIRPWPASSTVSTRTSWKGFRASLGPLAHIVHIFYPIAFPGEILPNLHVLRWDGTARRHLICS
jgi:hypothetical protein